MTDQLAVRLLAFRNAPVDLELHRNHHSFDGQAVPITCWAAVVIPLYRLDNRTHGISNGDHGVSQKKLGFQPIMLKLEIRSLQLKVIQLQKMICKHTVPCRHC